jgi:hypothetical protein
MATFPVVAMCWWGLGCGDFHGFGGLTGFWDAYGLGEGTVTKQLVYVAGAVQDGVDWEWRCVPGVDDHIRIVSEEVQPQRCEVLAEMPMPGDSARSPKAVTSSWRV